MIVYGDRCERVDLQEQLRATREQCKLINDMPTGLARHSAVVGLLIDAGRLLQAIEDAEFEIAAEDRRSPVSAALTTFTIQLAAAVMCSWDSEFNADLRLPSLPELPDLPQQAELKVPEGYAFYSLYPEAYATAARTVHLTCPPCVIGIRSIGTSLGAIVAAAVGADSFVTVRPFGHPFGRKVAIAPDLEQELLDQVAHYLIVDEGPGQSGSSFGAVADWLETRGVPLERVTFLPSHDAGLGPHASERNRARWARSHQAVGDIGPRLPNLLERWLADLIGPVDAPLEDLSAGAWRSRAYEQERHWPAVNPLWERRKYLARTGEQTSLLKFAGLGAEAERKLEIAKALHEQGFVPAPHGLVHGFLIERWHDDAVRLTPDDKPLNEIARYLGWRARHLAADEAQGASIEELFAMARHNILSALGDADWLEPWQHRLRRLQSQVVRVLTDNRMQSHEWLRLPSGRLLKCDALDHHCAHDLIGAQDVSWDVAGASIEFALDERQTAWLAAEVRRLSGHFVDPKLLEFMTIAYLGFALGQTHFAIAMCADQAESNRLKDNERRYLDQLRQRTPAYDSAKILV